tara:strand:+ start:1830 stop:2069 length:240 start_codon:yes stop_codon:yes gene_type:complete
MVDLSKPWHVIKRDFVILYGLTSLQAIEAQYCKAIGRKHSEYTKDKLWKNAALQDDLAVLTIKVYEESANGKRNRECDT